jgi:hypothetical protein
MEFENDDKWILNKMVAPLVGKKAWGVKKGYGSFLTIEFGAPFRDQIINVEFGEWHLWAYFCHWRINKNDKFIVGSESPEKKIADMVKAIEGLQLKVFSICPKNLDAILEFEGGITLELSSNIAVQDDEDADNWLLFMPNNKILVADHKGKWKIETE